MLLDSYARRNAFIYHWGVSMAHIVHVVFVLHFKWPLWSLFSIVILLVLFIQVPLFSMWKLDVFVHVSNEVTMLNPYANVQTLYVHTSYCITMRSTTPRQTWLSIDRKNFCAVKFSSSRMWINRQLDFLCMHLCAIEQEREKEREFKCWFFHLLL